MKKLFLIGIAALSVLSASAAHARPWAAYHCGKYRIAELPPKYFWPTREKCSGSMRGSVVACDGRAHYFRYEKRDYVSGGPLVDRWVLRDKEDLLTSYKGKPCRQFDDKEY